MVLQLTKWCKTSAKGLARTLSLLHLMLHAHHTLLCSVPSTSAEAIPTVLRDVIMMKLPTSIELFSV